MERDPSGADVGLNLVGVKAVLPCVVGHQLDTPRRTQVQPAYVQLFGWLLADT
jgi:hypothetical protein